MPLNPYDEMVESLEDQQPAQAEPNPYEQLIVEADQRQHAVLSETLRGGKATTPDARAEALKLGQQFGQPVEVIERNRDDFKARASTQDDIVGHILQRNPKLGQWLSENVDVAPAAQDDLPGLIKLENNLTFGGAILRGVDNTQAMFGRFMEWSGEAVGSRRLTEYGRDVATFNEAQSEALGKRWTLDSIKNPADFAQYVKDTIGEQIPIMGPAVAGGAAGAGVGTLIAPGIGTTIGGVIGAFFPSLVLGIGETQGNLKQLDPNAVAPGTVFLGGSAVAAFDTALPGHIGSRLVRTFGRQTAEEIAKSALTATLKPQFVRTLAKEGLVSMSTEGVTEALQEAIGAVAAAQGSGQVVDWDKTWQQMVEAGAAGALTGGVFGAGGVAVTHNTEVARYAQAKQQELFFAELAAGATDSKLRQRLPDAYRSFIANATKDGPVENLYIGTEEFKTYWQSKDINPAVMAQQLTGSVTALADAEAAGLKLAIPTATYATEVAATEHHGFFAKELTLSPEGLNTREAAAVQTMLEEQALSIADAVERAATAPVTEAGGVIQQGIRAQLEADPQFQAMATTQGVDVSEAANTYAAGVEAVFTTLGARLGKAPEELLERFGLQFGAPAPETADLPGLEAGQPENAPAAGVPVTDPAEAFLGAPEGSEGPTEGQLAQAARREPVQEQHTLQRAPADVVRGRMRVSTRVPTAVKAPVAPARLRTDLAVLQASKAKTKVAAVVGTYPQVPDDVKAQGDDAVLEHFIGQGVRNLKWLWELMPAATRDRAKLWYVGAHRVALDLADEFGYTDQQAAAILAVLSPKTDWFKNVAYARAASKVFAIAERDNPVFDKTLFNHYRARVLESFDTSTKRVITKKDGEAAAAKERRKLVEELRLDRQLYEGKAWLDLDDLGQARLLRAYVELHEDLTYQVIMPEGEDAGVKRTKKGEPAKMGWTSYSITAQAIGLMRDGSPVSIQERLGGEHKVRSFFNNISDPWDADSVTIDTHAVAAVHLEPFSSNSIPVVKTMSGFGDNLLGLSGANAIYAEAYFRAAEEISASTGAPVLPREVQSVTWEAVRLLFPPEQKRADAPAVVAKLWRDFESGKITEDQLHGQLTNQPGRISAPDWADTPARVAVDEGRLREGHGVPLRPDVPARRGDDRAGAGITARANARLADGPVVLFQGAPAAAPDVFGRRSTARRILGDLDRSATRPYARGSGAGIEGLRGVARYAPVLPFAAAFTKANYPAPVVFELERSTESAAAFHRKITASKAASKFGAAVYVYDVADYHDMRLFLTEDGANGFAIKPDGDIVSVFSAGGGNVHAMLALATQEGGTKLDCFDTVLPDLYAVNGFKVVKREPWNDAFKPDGWDAATFAKYNAGQPDVVYMEYDPVALQTGPTTLFQSATPLTGVQWAHSRLAKAVELSQLQRASGQQWKATIKNSKAGINQDEFLFAQVGDLDDATVYTRQEVLDYLKANELKVEWATFSNEGPTAQQVTEEANKVYRWMVDNELRKEFYEDIPIGEPSALEEDGEWSAFVDGERFDWGYDTEEEAFAAAVGEVEKRAEYHQINMRQMAEQRVSWDAAVATARENLRADDGAGGAPFAEYTEPGAEPETYREVLLHGPQFGRTGYSALTPAENERMRDGMAVERRRLRDLTETRRFIGGEPDPDDTPDTRRAAGDDFIDRTVARWERRMHAPAESGGPLSRSEENRLRADAAILLKLKASGDYAWRQAGWKDGHAAYAQVENPIVRLRFNQRTTSDGKRVLFLEEVQPPQSQNFDKMPPLLQKNWREIGFKWALAHGVELGVDAVAWTTGAMQAQRYSLATKVEAMRWTAIDAEAPPYADGHRYSMTLETDDGPNIKLRFDDNQKITWAQGLGEGQDDSIIGQSLESVIGKDMAREVAEARSGTLQADQLIGGEGLRKLYDEDFRNVVNKLPAVKKSGGRVESVSLVFRESAEDQRRVYPPHIERMPQGPERRAAEDAFDAPMLVKLKRDVPAVVLTPEVKANVASGQALFQGERGFIRFGAERQFNIQLLKDADLSTVLHELGHFYLEVLGDLTAEMRQADPTTLGPGQAGVLKDYEAILAWLGVADRSGIGVEQHEQFARGFEAYLFEGIAPNPALKSAFGRYRSWLVKLYRSVTALAVNVTPEVRGVFDRLVATDDAIERAKTEGQIEPFATAELAGMTDIEFEAYREVARKANEAARDALQARLMKELTRERTALWKQRQAAVRLQVAADVHNRPDQVALAVLTLGRRPDGAPLPAGAEDLKLSKDSIVSRYGKARLSTLPKPWVYQVDGGIDVEVAAPLFGFASGDALLSALAAAEKPDVVINRETAQRMKAEFGDMRIDGTLHAAAKRAVQENGHDAVLSLELRGIAKKVREVRPFIKARMALGSAEQKSAIKAALAALGKMAPLEQVRAVAEARIATIRVRDLKPGQYWAAAKNAGQASLEAATAGKYEEALEQKIKQRLAAELYRAANNAADEVDAVGRYARKFSQPGPRARLGKAGDSYLQQVDALLEKFEFADVSGKALEKRSTLLAWVEQRQKEGFDTSGIPAELLEAAQRTNYRTLTLTELRVVRDAVKQIEALASLKNRLLKNQDTRNFVAVRDGLVAQAVLQGDGRPRPIEYREAEDRRHMLASWFASHAKISRLARALDSYKDGGPFWSAIIRPLNEAADAEVTRNGLEGKRYAAIINKHYPGRELAGWNRKVTVEGVGALALETRLAVALNYGNESSRSRLTSDPVRKWNDRDVANILATLDRRDWLFVQDTWDFVDTFWQEISDKQQRVTGLRPEKVDAVPVVTKFGTFRGGYYPLAYDGRMSVRAGQHTVATEAKLALGASYVNATTRRGHVESRQDNVRLALKLDMSVMFNHVTQVVHDLTHHEALIDVSRLLRDGAVSQAILDHAGEPVYRQFTSALEDIATGGVGSKGPMDRAANFMRTGTQIAAMGYSAWTALQQPLGIFNGMARVGPTWVAKGMVRWMKDAATMENTAAWINEVSPMMRARGTTATQDLNDLRQQLAKPGGWFDTLLREVTRDAVNKQTLVDSYLWHIGLAQRVADIPTWLGGYEKAMASGVDETTAFRLADQAVLDAQGGGQVKDLAQVQRGGPAAKLFMVFYSYGSTLYNAQAEVYGRSKLTTAKGLASFIGNMSLLYVFPAFGSVALSRLFGKTDDEDDETFLVDMAREMLSTAMNTMVLARELSGIVQDGSRGYAGPAGTRFISMIYALGNQVKQGEVDEKLFETLNAVGGILFRYPASQVQRTIDGWAALEEGRTSNPGVLLVGPPRE